MKTSPVQILILDDDGTFRQYLKVRFSLENWITHEARTLHEARECMKNNLIHVFLIDVYLHAESGLNLVSEIREQEEALKKPLVIAISGNIQEALVSESEFLSQYRVDDFFEKPFQVTEMIEKIKKLLALQERRLPPDNSNDGDAAAELDPGDSFS